MITAALVTFAVLLAGWLLAPAEPAPQASEPLGHEALPQAA